MARANESTGLSIKSIKLEEMITIFLGMLDFPVSPPDIRKYVNYLSTLLNGTSLSEKEINYGISLLYQKNYLSTENGHYVILTDKGKKWYRSILSDASREMLEELIEYSILLRSILLTT